MNNTKPTKRPLTSAMRKAFSMLRLMGGSAPAHVCGDMRTLNAMQLRCEIQLFGHNGRLWITDRTNTKPANTPTEN